MAKFTNENGVASGGIRTNSATQEMTLGTKVCASGGRVYRYVKAGGTALVAGKLYDGPARVTNHSTCAVVTGTAGDTELVVTLGATLATEDHYAGGIVNVYDEDGQGQTLSIKSHPAADSGANLTITLDDDEPIVTALTTSSQVQLVPNQYKSVIIHAASETGLPVGVAITAITACYYGFIQTRGPVSVLADSSPAALGQQVDASTTTDGAVTLGTVGTAGIGYSYIQAVSTEYNPIFLMLS